METDSERRGTDATRVPSDAVRLTSAGYEARVEHAILFTVSAWDANCPQHLPKRFRAAGVAEALAARDGRIAALEVEVARLMSGTAAG